MIEPHSSSERVGLFGGSFNPPHICHTLATTWVLQTQSVDEIWWIPTYQHPFSKDLVDYEDRFRMAELATARLKSVSVSDIERQIGGESRTIKTVKRLSREYPGLEYCLVIGSDILEEADDWKQWNELTELVELVVVGRQGHPVPDERSSVMLPDISSSEIRRALSTRTFEQVVPRVPRRVLEYIDRQQLYLDTDEVE